MKRCFRCSALLAVVVLFFVLVAKGDSSTGNATSPAKTNCGAFSDCRDAAHPFPSPDSLAPQKIGGLHEGASSIEFINAPQFGLARNGKLSDPLLTGAPDSPDCSFWDAALSSFNFSANCGSSTSLGDSHCDNSPPADFSLMSYRKACKVDWSSDPFSSHIPATTLGTRPLFPAPEPSSLALLGSGCLLVYFSLRRATK